MPIISGSVSLTQGVTTATVSFPVAFLTTPVIVPTVANVSADPAKLLINAVIVDASGTVFTVELDQATDSPNYTLEWIAGTPDQFTALVNYAHQLLEAQKLKPKIGDQDCFVGISRDKAYPETVLFPATALDSRFVKRVTTPPAAPNSPGTPGDFAVGPGYAYFRGSSVWFRVPLLPGTSWSEDETIKPTRKGVVSLNTVDQIQAVVFATPFPSGSSPNVRCHVQNLAGNLSELLFIQAMPVAASLSGFSVALTAIPNVGSYELMYEAVQD